MLLDDFPEERADKMADELSSGKWTHDYPLTSRCWRELGLPVSTELPREVFELMDLYPQVGRQRPSVQYVPMPYPRPDAPPRLVPSGEKRQLACDDVQRDARHRVAAVVAGGTAPRRVPSWRRPPRPRAGDSRSIASATPPATSFRNFQ